MFAICICNPWASEQSYKLMVFWALLSFLFLALHLHSQELIYKIRVTVYRYWVIYVVLHAVQYHLLSINPSVTLFMLGRKVSSNLQPICMLVNSVVPFYLQYHVLLWLRILCTWAFVNLNPRYTMIYWIEIQGKLLEN